MSNRLVATRLESILDFKNGKTVPSEIGTIPVYGGNGILGYTGKSNYENVIILGRVGAYCGSVHFEEGKCWVSDNAIAGVHKDKSCNKFNYYLLKSLSLNKKQIGSSQPLLTQDILNHISVNTFTDSKYKSKIAAVLSALDAKIELNNRINAELEAMAKTLYDFWFVQFDFPDKNGKPYNSSGGKMIWNKELKREIPVGWATSRLGNALKTSLGGTPSTHNKAYWENGTHHWLNSGEVAKFPVVTSELKITGEAIKKSATELLPSGTCLLSITRHIRPTILAIDACANQSVVGIKESGNIHSCLIFPYLKNEIPRFMQLRTGAQQPHINKEIVDDAPIVIPDSKVLDLYNQHAKPLYNQIINNAFQNQHLSTLRDWLLPMLMNGQVKVR
jgi:type I restriction enzyme S subunit